MVYLFDLIPMIGLAVLTLLSPFYSFCHLNFLLGHTVFTFFNFLNMENICKKQRYVHITGLI